MSWLQRLFGGDRQAERPDGVPRVPEPGDVAAGAARPPVAEVALRIGETRVVVPLEARLHTVVIGGTTYHHVSDDPDGTWVYVATRRVS